jgi:hypothetical protein
MKFLFMDGIKCKAIHTDLSRVLKGHAVSVNVCKYWCRRFKAGNFSMDDRVRPRRPPIELSGAIMSLLSDEPFLSAPVLAVRLSSTHQTINRVMMSHLGMRSLRSSHLKTTIRCLETYAQNAEGLMFVVNVLQKVAANQCERMERRDHRADAFGKMRTRCIMSAEVCEMGKGTEMTTEIPRRDQMGHVGENVEQRCDDRMDDSKMIAESVSHDSRWEHG